MALLFEAENPMLLEGLLATQVKMAAAKTPTAKEEEGEANGLKYHGLILFCRSKKTKVQATRRFRVAAGNPPTDVPPGKCVLTLFSMENVQCV